MTKKDTLADISSIKLVARYYGMNVEQQDDLVTNRQKYEKTGEHAEIYEIADQLNGIAIGTSRHPCAAMLYDGDIEKTFGLIRFKDGTIGVPVTGTSADIFKYLKLDFLVATTWTIIDNAFKDAGIKTPDVKELSKLIYSEDSKAFQIASDGITATVCQFNTANGKQKISEFKPRTVGEMSDLSAIMRPGAASLLDAFLKRVNFKYGVKVLDDYLASATGCRQSYMIYQEHAMQVMQMAGITLADSYVVLKAISKKKEDVINSFKEQFINGFIDYLLNYDKSINRKDAEEISSRVWKIIEDSSRYSFNASHSLSYSFDAAYALYLKDKHPFSYYKAALDDCMNDKDATKELLSELPYFNITLSPPIFEKASTTYTYDAEKRIIYRALNSLNGIGEEVTKRVIEMGKMNFKYFTDILIYISEDKDFKLDKTKMRNLILVGFFRSYGSEIKLLKLQKEFLTGKNKYACTSKFPDKKEAILRKKRELLIDFELSSEEIFLPKAVSIRYQLEVMSISYDTDINMKGWYIVSKVDGDNTKKIFLYDLATGEEKMLKYSAANFRERPIEPYQLLEVLVAEDKPLSWINEFGKWEKDPSRMQTWLLKFNRQSIGVE